MDRKSPEYLAIAEYFMQEGLRLSREWKDAFALALRPDHSEQEIMYAALLLARLKAFNKFSKDIYAIISSNSD